MSPPSTDAQGSQRRLAAILSMDAVGYTRLMAANEAATVRTLTKYRDEIALLVGRHGGRVVDDPGDNVLCEFPAATSAVACALEIQRVLGVRNGALDAEHRLVFRVGVHLGEVLAQGPRIYGDGVNIAARLEGLAEPGGVCASQVVRDQVGTKLAVAFDDLGEQTVKNMPQPVRVYRVRRAEAGSAAVLRPANARSRAPRWGAAAGFLLLLLASGAWWLRDRTHATGAAVASLDVGFGSRPAIAVLPFDDLSADPNQAYFADGLAEDLIARLSAWRAFPVIARNSSFQYRGGGVDLKRVSGDLGARYLVEGSVRRAGDRIRVTAQLIDAPTNEHVWAESYDREVKDVFALQDEISATIAASLIGDLTRAEGERARQRGTENLEAWSLYELGVQRLDRYTPEDAVEARHLFERAVALDPRFATAVAQLAMASLWGEMFGWSDAPEKKLSAALETARHAVELDPRDPAAHVALGWAFLLTGDARNGFDATRRAVDLNPSMPEAWFWFGWAQMVTGDPEAGIASNERARRLNPQGPMAFLADDNLAWGYWQTGRFEAGLEAGHRLVAARPTYWPGYMHVALNAVELGRTDEARAAIAQGRRVEPAMSLALLRRSIGVSRPEIDARRDAALRKAGLE